MENQAELRFCLLDDVCPATGLVLLAGADLIKLLGNIVDQFCHKILLFPIPGNADLRGRINAVGLIVEVACFVRECILFSNVVHIGATTYSMMT